MTKPGEGTEPEKIGDHAVHSNSEDLVIEDAGCLEGLTQIFSTTWSGPYLGSLGSFPDISDRYLEARIWHHKGLLPTSILPADVRRLELDPWLRELVCRIQVIDYNTMYGEYTYFIKIFAKVPEAPIQGLETESVHPRPSIEANNIRPDLNRLPDVNDNGVRGQARGLVSKALLERLDGTENYGANRQVDSSRGPKTEFQVYPRAPGFQIPADFLPLQLKGIHAACMEALKEILFRNAKSVERTLFHLYDPVQSSAPTYITDKAKRFTYSTYKLPEKLTFCNKVKIIARDDDVLKSSLDGELFAKVAPGYNTESFASTENLNDIKSDTSTTDLSNTKSTTCTKEPNDTEKVTATETVTAALYDTEAITAALYDTEAVTAALHDTEAVTAALYDTEAVTAALYDTDSVAVDPRDSTSLTSDISDNVYDKHKAVVKSRGQRIHSILARLFCCIPWKRGENYTV